MEVDSYAGLGAINETSVLLMLSASGHFMVVNASEGTINLKPLRHGQ
jgi:hypothetical protein